MSDLTKGPWVACVSSSDDFDICTAIKDKGNGNCIVANEIDEDYESLLLALPDMYQMLSKIAQMSGGELANFVENSDEIEKLLEKARGKQ